MKQMFKKRLLLILFLATVLVYAVALFWSIRDYKEMKRSWMERTPPEFKPFREFNLYIATKQGWFMVLLGFPIGLIWVIGIGFLGDYMEHRDLKLLARIIPFCGFLCILFGIAVSFHSESNPLGYGVVIPFRDYAHPLVALGIIFVAISPVILANAKKKVRET